MRTRELTEQDLNELIGKFKKYCETAEQHEFARLLMLEMMISQHPVNEVIKDQKEARAMYRTIAKTIGVNCSDYEEV